MSWTDERIATLKKMWKEGKSAADIAKVLGKNVTRNAIIGKAHRMGLSGRPSPIKKPPSAGKKEAPRKETPARETKKAPEKQTKAAAGPVREPVSEPVKFEREAIPPGGGVALIDLTERMCKWPIGDPQEDDFTFCGRNIRPGTPYCPDHAAAAYQTSSRRVAVTVTVEDKEDKEDDAEDSSDDVDDDEEEENGDEAVA